MRVWEQRRPRVHGGAGAARGSDAELPAGVQDGQALQHVEIGGQLLWTCEACKDGQYSVNANDPTSGCNACPLGALCEQGQLQGLVADSLWEKDEPAGIMRLVSLALRPCTRAPPETKQRSRACG